MDISRAYGQGNTEEVQGRPELHMERRNKGSLDAEQALHQLPGLGPTVYGYAFESIAIEFGIESAKDFGPALNLLKWELDTYHHNGDSSTLR